MAPQAAVVSYRLGGDDGVSVEARKWAWALGELGFEVRRVAGLIEDDGRPDDIVIAELSIDSGTAPTAAALADSLDGTDLVIADNICSLPLNLDAARAVAGALTNTRSHILFRHHDLPWQRRKLDHLSNEFPPRLDGAMHATVNLRSRRELEARGYAGAVAVHNRFDLEAPLGDRDSTRTALGFEADELIVFQPARAIERKNVPGGIRFASRLAELVPDQRVHYWISGPAEDGYGPTLDKILARADVPVTLGRAATSVDAYAACDVVVFPSTWEGFGNPIIEAIAARRPLAAFAYPVLAEILATGVRVFSTDAPENIARFLREPEVVRERYFDINLHRARLSFACDDLPRAIDDAFRAHGWTAW